MRSKRKPSIKVDAFVKELVAAIPSNIFLSKVLNISACSVSRIRKKYNLAAAGKYSNSDTNLKKFMPEYVELCIKHDKKADGLRTPVSKPENALEGLLIKGQASYPISQIPFSEVTNIVNINGRDIEVKNGDKLEVKEGKVLLIREL